MSYPGRRWVEHENYNFCCNACHDINFCATEEMINMHSHIRRLQRDLNREKRSRCGYDCDNMLINLNNALERKNYEIWRNNNEILSLRRTHTQEIEKLKTELQETKKTLQAVLDENPYKEELDEIKSCKICLEQFDDNEREAVKLECPHIFCKKCVKKIQDQRWAKFSYQKYSIVFG